MSETEAQHIDRPCRIILVKKKRKEPKHITNMSLLCLYYLLLNVVSLTQKSTTMMLALEVQKQALREILENHISSLTNCIISSTLSCFYCVCSLIFILELPTCRNTTLYCAVIQNLEHS